MNYEENKIVEVVKEENVPKMVEID